MKTIKYTALGLILVLSAFAWACATEPRSISNTNAPGSPAPSASPSATASSQAVPVTLPVLDALFSDEAFKTKLKSTVELTDDQLAQLQKIAGEEVARLRQLNTEERAGDAELSSQARERASEAIRGVIGEQKAGELFTLASQYWVAGNEGLEAGKTDKGVTEIGRAHV